MSRKKFLCDSIRIHNVPVKFVDNGKIAIAAIGYTEADEELFFLTPENAKRLQSRLAHKAPYSYTTYSFDEPKEVELEIMDMNEI